MKFLLNLISKFLKKGKLPVNLEELVNAVKEEVAPEAAPEEAPEPEVKPKKSAARKKKPAAKK